MEIPGQVSAEIKNWASRRSAPADNGAILAKMSSSAATAPLRSAADGEDFDETSHRDAPWFSRTVEQREGGRDNPFQQRPFGPHAGEDANPHEHPEKMMGKRLRRQ